MVECWSNLLKPVQLRSPRIGSQSTASHKLAVGCMLVAALFLELANAADISVAPGQGTLQLAIDQAPNGASLQLQPGTYTGGVIVNKPLTLQGQQASVVDAGGKGHVIEIDAPNVVIRNLTISGSGDSLASEDSGIFVTQNSANVVIQHNRLEANLIGIYIKGAANALLRNNTIIGSQNPHMNDRGNSVQIWNADGAIVEGNFLKFGRDGIFVTTSRNNVYRDNHIEDMRFAIHYMYTHDSTLSGNVSLRNHSAFALMFSDRLKVVNNVSDSSRDRGLFLNFVNYSSFIDNTVRGGTDKCVFIYNATSNLFSDNQFSDCDIGIHYTAGSDKNSITRNSFSGNRSQVKYVGTRHIEWSVNGQGNYWSDNPAFDLDNNGIADRPYYPNDLVDQIIWRYPLAKLLINSPATQVLRWAQSEFPSLHPGGITDSAPLMNRPASQLITVSENND